MAFGQHFIIETENHTWIVLTSQSRPTTPDLYHEGQRTQQLLSSSRWGPQQSQSGTQTLEVYRRTTLGPSWKPENVGADDREGSSHRSNRVNFLCSKTKGKGSKRGMVFLCLLPEATTTLGVGLPTSFKAPNTIASLKFSALVTFNCIKLTQGTITTVLNSSQLA